MPATAASLPPRPSVATPWPAAEERTGYMQGWRHCRKHKGNCNECSGELIGIEGGKRKNFRSLQCIGKEKAKNKVYVRIALRKHREERH